MKAIFGLLNFLIRSKNATFTSEVPCVVDVSSMEWAGLNVNCFRV